MLSVLGLRTTKVSSELGNHSTVNGDLRKKLYVTVIYTLK